MVSYLFQELYQYLNYQCTLEMNVDYSLVVQLNLHFLDDIVCGHQQIIYFLLQYGASGVCAWACAAAPDLMACLLTV